MAGKAAEAAGPMIERYRRFLELERVEKEGVAWSREYVDRGSATLIMAPHGGWIEPFTARLAAAIAREDLSWYAFRGLKEQGNQSLHITSHRFDEPLALEAAGRARWVVAIHGEKTRHQGFVMVGGLWNVFRAEATRALADRGFAIEDAREGLGGVNPKNICNRGQAGIGGQLELSEGMRRALHRDGSARRAFANGVRAALAAAESMSERRTRSGPGGEA